jgi:hypothetical protein
MLTCEMRLFVPKGCFTAYVSGMAVVDEIFWPELYERVEYNVFCPLKAPTGLQSLKLT